MALNNLGMGLLFTAKDLASQNIKKLERRFKSLDATTEEAEAKFTSNVKNMGVGLGLFAAGAIGLSALGGTVGEARSFGKAIAEVSTLVDEATFSTEKMRELTMDLAATFGVDAIQQAPALYQAISAGASDVEAATAIMTEANKFAIGGVTDLTSAVDVLSKSVNVFGSQGLTAADAADTMFIAIKTGVTTAEELSSTLGRVAPLAKELGINFQELNAAIAATTKSGLSTKEAVTGLKAALANIAKPTADAQKEAKRLGIEFTATGLRSKGLAKFLQEITSNAKFNKDSMIKLFGSIEGVNTILALTTDNAANFKSILEEMDNRGGAATKAFDKMNSTLDQQLKRLGAVWKNIKIGIGTALAPLVKVLASAAEKLLNLFGRLPGPIKTAFAIIAAGAAILLTVGGAVLFFKGALGALLLLMPGIATAAAAMWTALFGPIGLIVLAIAALTAVIIIFWDDIVAAWQAAVDFMVGVIEDFVDFFRTLWNDTGAIIRGIISLYIDLWKGFLGVMKKFGLFLVDVLTFPYRMAFKAWKAIFEAVVDVMRGVADFVVGVFADAFEFLGEVATGVASSIMFVFGLVRTVLEPIVEFLREAAQLAKDVFGFASGVVGSVTGFGGDIGEGLFNLVGGDGGVSDAGTIAQGRRTFSGSSAIPTSPLVATGAQRGAGATTVTVEGGKTELTSNIRVELDGEVIATAVAKQNAEDARRRSQTTPGGID